MRCTGALLTDVVTLTVEAPKKASFRCPSCSRKIAVRARFHLDWRFKSCPGCNAVWCNDRWLGPFDGAISDECVGRAYHLTVFATIR